MSVQSDKFQDLLKWDIYKSSDNFKSYVIENRLEEDEQRVLITAYGELEKYHKSQDITLSDASAIDKAMEIKNRYSKREKFVLNITNEDSSTESSNREFETLEFRGNTMEYFKIWIVNIFLSIVTLGIYSAWAKVRTNRYFYANTFYQNSSFEYTADPLNILKGRAIIVAFYGLFIFSAQVLLNPIIAGGIFLLFILALPWFINRAIKFKLKYVKHRSINFRYDENAPSFYKFFLLHMVINIVTIGLAYPYSLNKFKKLLIDNSKFGNSEFQYAGETKNMYKQFFKVLGSYIGYILAPMFVLGLVSYFLIPQGMGLASNPSLFVILAAGAAIASYIFFIIVGFAIKGFYDAYITNYVWSNTTIKENSFQSTLKPLALAWIYISNIFAIIFSLGLLTPWAKIRVAKYKCENFAIAATDISSFIATQQENQSALGEETGDFFDIDIGI